MLSVASLLAEPDAPSARFWTLTAVCSVPIGLLVLTRMTPIFLIPAFALLFFRRMPMYRIVQFTGAASVMTVLMLLGTMLANQERLGRFELTNSSGRHLWQGITTFTDAALADSPVYQQLKSQKPNIQGLDWWKVPPVAPGGMHYVQADPRE